MTKNWNEIDHFSPHGMQRPRVTKYVLHTMRRLARLKLQTEVCVCVPLERHGEREGDESVGEGDKGKE